MNRLPWRLGLLTAALACAPLALAADSCPAFARNTSRGAQGWACLCKPGYYHGADFYTRGGSMHSFLTSNGTGHAPQMLEPFGDYKNGRMRPFTMDEVPCTSSKLCKIFGNPQPYEFMFRQAVPAELYAAGRSIAETKPFDLYSGDADGKCTKCPEGVWCNRTGMAIQDLVLKSGYWRVNEFSASIEKCAVAGACTGGDRQALVHNGSCAAAHRVLPRSVGWGFVCTSTREPWHRIRFYDKLTWTSHDRLIWTKLFPDTSRSFIANMTHHHFLAIADAAMDCPRVRGVSLPSCDNRTLLDGALCDAANSSCALTGPEFLIPDFTQTRRNRWHVLVEQRQFHLRRPCLGDDRFIYRRFNASYDENWSPPVWIDQDLHLPGLVAAVQAGVRLHNPRCTACAPYHFRQMDGSCVSCDSRAYWAGAIVCSALALTLFVYFCASAHIGKLSKGDKVLVRRKGSRRPYQGEIFQVNDSVTYGVKFDNFRDFAVPKKFIKKVSCVPARCRKWWYAQNSLGAQMRVLATVLQVQVQLGAVLQVVYPATVRKILGWLRLPLSLDIFNVFPSECGAYAFHRYYSTYFSMRASQLVAFAVALGCFVSIGIIAARRKHRGLSRTHSFKVQASLLLMGFCLMVVLGTPLVHAINQAWGDHSPQLGHFNEEPALVVIPFILFFCGVLPFWPWCKIGDCVTKVMEKDVASLPTVLNVLFLLQPPVTAYVFKMFACERFDDGSEYSPATRFSSPCFDMGDFTSYTWIFGVLVWPVGVTLFYFALLWSHRGDISDPEWRDEDENKRKRIVSKRTSGMTSIRLPVGTSSEDRQPVNPILASVKCCAACSITCLCWAPKQYWEMLSESREYVDDNIRNSFEGTHWMLRPFVWLVQLLHLCALVVLHPILLAAPTTEGAREVDNRGNKSWLSTGALHSLYGSYRPEYWWFEIPLVLYRIFMVGILTVIRPGEGEQVAIGMTIEVFFIFVFLKLKPYKDPENGTLDVVGHVIILAWLAISSTRFDDSAVVTACYITLLIGAPLMFMYMWLKKACGSESERKTPASSQQTLEEVPNPISVTDEQEQQDSGEDVSKARSRATAMGTLSSSTASQNAVV